MDKLELKKNILQKAREKQKEIIRNFKIRIEELKNSEMIINEDQFDDGLKASDESNYELINNLVNQLNFANEKLHTLVKMLIDSKPHQTIATGSIVKTDKRNFFVSVNLDKFTVNNEVYYGISTSAPLFEHMQDKKAGDFFTFKNENYHIKEVF